MLIIALLAAALMQDGVRPSIPADPRESSPSSRSLFSDFDELAASSSDPIICVRAGSMYEMKACAATDMERETERMQRYVEAATVRAREGDLESVEYGPRSRQEAYLSESQVAWQAYVDVRCAGVLEATSGGTMGGLGNMWCVTTMTRQRTHDIWADHLTYWDSTPPVLPEPVRTIAEDRVAAGLD